MPPGNARLTRARRLRKPWQFAATTRKGQRLFTRHFLVFVRATREAAARLGITVSRKVGCAVRRNRIKRLVREVFRQATASTADPIDIVVIARPGISLPTYVEVDQELASALAAYFKRTMRRDGARSGQHS